MAHPPILGKSGQHDLESPPEIKIIPELVTNLGEISQPLLVSSGVSHQEVPTPNPSGPTWPGKFPEIWTSNSTWGIFQQTMWLITRGYIR